MGVEHLPIEAGEEKILSEKERGAAESAPEKEEVMEKARIGRASLASKIFSRETAYAMGNLTPGIDVAKFTTEAIRGKTLGGKELSGKERMNYALIAGSVALTYAFYIAGKPHEAIKAKEFSMGISVMQFGPGVLKGAREKFSQAVDLAEKSFNYVNDGKLLEDVEGQIKEYLKTPIVVSPDLNAD